METWHVYQLRSDTELLYVGYTRHLERRLSQHRRTQPWWPEVTGTPSEEFTTEDAARQREKELWASERPKHNRQNPFQTDEERKAKKRAEEKKWASAHREQTRAACRAYYARNAEALRAKARENSQRPEVRARARERQARLRGVPQQPGPGLF
jgi:predicted GIY-YIG superfamily endonuclease